MKVRCIVETEKRSIPNSYVIYFGDVTNNEIYEVLAIEKGWYRIVDASGEDYLYPADLFEIINEG